MLNWLNPLNLIKLFTLIKALLDSATALYRTFKEKQSEKAAEKAKKEAQEAVDELQNTPIDQTKTKEEKDKDAEAAADRFHDRLK
jgi:ElaB/YqjD/DUF883 family membrane-anchored ribosome-binding protein